MRKTILATSLAAATLGFSSLSFGQAAAAAPAPDYTLTGNLGLFSSYRFRGIAQTYDKPAIQGGIDFSHVSGFYAGNWDSNVNEGAGYPGGSIERLEEVLGRLGPGPRRHLLLLPRHQRQRDDSVQPGQQQDRAGP
jgi:hypothetical protein